MKFEISQNQNIVLDLLAKALFGKQFTSYSNEVNWSLVWHESYMQAVSLLVFSDFSRDNECLQDFEALRKMLKKRLAINLNINKEHLHLQKLLSDENIPFVIIKGLSSGVYYPDPLLRSMGDVDFLIDLKDKEKATSVLLKNGFKESGKSHGDHIVFTNSVSRFEMHFEPAGIPSGTVGDKIRSMLDDILSSSVNMQTPFGEITVPSAFHHGMIVLLHSCHHLTGEGIGLRHLCDWAVFVSSMSDDEFCVLFEQKLRSVGLWRFAQVLYTTCEKYLGAPHKNWAGDIDGDLSLGIIEDVFKGGNFGQKSNDRTHERMILPLYGDEGSVGKSYIGRLVSSVNKAVIANWKLAGKFRILLPLGWLIFGGRYVIRSLFGKRPKIRIKKLYEEANKRIDLFSELSLFDNKK